MRERIYLVPYDVHNVEQQAKYCPTGLLFEADQPVLFLGNKPFPKNMETYIELEIYDYVPIHGFRSIPIYMGVHQETSMGILNGELAFGSLFVNDEMKNFTTFEHHRGETSYFRSTPTKITSRIPAKKEYLGMSVDPTNNRITIYREGEVVYRFTVTKFSMQDYTIYPALYVVNGCSITGKINFGRVRCERKPNNMFSFYGYYYKTQRVGPEITFSFMPDAIPPEREEILIRLEADTDITLGQEVPLFLESDTAEWKDDAHKKFHLDYVNHPDHNTFGHTVVSNRPIPYETKVYLEWRFRNGVIPPGTGGIPISVGLTNNKHTAMVKSVRMQMLHQVQSKYKWKEVYENVIYDHLASDLLTSVGPNQSMWVGVAFDLMNREYTISINSIPWYVVKIDKMKYVYGEGEYLYFMLHDDGLFLNTSNTNGEVNFGEEPMHTVVPEGYITLWDYYNHFYRIPCDNEANTIIFYYWGFGYKLPISYDISFVFYSISLDMIPPEGTNNGMNKYLATYNMVHDLEPHFTPDDPSDPIDLRDLIDNLVREDNHGYTTEDEFDKRDRFYGDILFPADWSF